jgi:hypothetical protein
MNAGRFFEPGTIQSSTYCPFRIGRTSDVSLSPLAFCFNIANPQLIPQNDCITAVCD